MTMMATEPEPLTGTYHGGSGPRMALLHGVGGSVRVWRDVLPRLTPHYEIWAPTLPGHRGGPPLPPAAQPDVRYLADRLEEWMDELGWDRVHIVGSSLGATMGLLLAERGRAHRATVFAPGIAWTRNLYLEVVCRKLLLGERLTKSPRTMRAAAYPAIRKLLLGQVAVHGDRIPLDDALGILADTRDDATLHSVLDGLRRDSWFRFDLPDDCPVDLIWGDQDVIMPFAIWGRPVLDVIPQAHLSFLRGVGHIPMFDRPDAVADIILRSAAQKR